VFAVCKLVMELWLHWPIYSLFVHWVISGFRRQHEWIF